MRPRVACSRTHSQQYGDDAKLLSYIRVSEKFNVFRPLVESVFRQVLRAVAVAVVVVVVITFITGNYIACTIYCSYKISVTCTVKHGLFQVCSCKRSAR
jgi:hypothetical protein